MLFEDPLQFRRAREDDPAGPGETPATDPQALATTVFAPPRRRRTRYYAFSSKLIALLSTADRVFSLLPKRQGALHPGGPWAVLVCNTAHIGDMAGLLPVIQALRASPEVSRVGVLTGSAGAEVLKVFAPDVPRHVFDHWNLSRVDQSLWQRLWTDFTDRPHLRDEIRNAGYDVALDAYPWFGNAATTLWAAGVPVRIGFASGGGGPLYTHVAAEDLAPERSVADASRLLFQPIAQAGFTVGRPLPVSAGFRADPLALSLAEQLGRYAVLHLGHGGRTQAWPLAHWDEVAVGLKRRGFQLVFTGTAEDAAFGAGVRGAWADHDAVGRGDLRYFATLLREAALVVSVDTGTPHLAGLFQTPTVIIPSGRQPLTWWRPEHPSVRQVTTATGCAPCYRSQGCAAMACLRATPSAAVLAAADEVTASAGR